MTGGGESAKLRISNFIAKSMKGLLKKAIPLTIATQFGSACIDGRPLTDEQNQEIQDRLMESEEALPFLKSAVRNGTSSLKIDRETATADKLGNIWQSAIDRGWNLLNDDLIYTAELGNRLFSPDTEIHARAYVGKSEENEYIILDEDYIFEEDPDEYTDARLAETLFHEIIHLVRGCTHFHAKQAQKSLKEAAKYNELPYFTGYYLHFGSLLAHSVTYNEINSETSYIETLPADTFQESYEAWEAYLKLLETDRDTWAIQFATLETEGVHNPIANITESVRVYETGLSYGAGKPMYEEIYLTQERLIKVLQDEEASGIIYDREVRRTDETLEALQLAYPEEYRELMNERTEQNRFSELGSLRFRK